MKTASKQQKLTFYERLATALVNDIERERNVEESEEIDEIELFPADDDDCDVDYVPNEDDASDIENEVIIEPNDLVDSDEEFTESETQNLCTSTSEECFYGKDGTKWEKNEPNTGVRIRQHNVMRFRSGPKERNSVPIEVFKKFFTPDIAFIIITETNRYGKDSIQKWNASNPGRKKKVWKDVTESELDAFIGILLAAGVSHNNTQKSEVLWRTDGLPIFRAAMSHKRFLLLTRYIRFDDGRTRPFRLQSDKAAPIRDIWNYMNENLAKNYSPYENITIDEQLFPYRGKTKFTQYIPSKPAKYGIKIWWACDSKTKYPLQGKLYTGRQEGNERETNQGENVMLQLAKSYSNSGRTIIADNFFTTLEGAKRLTKIGLAFVVTIRSNKRCIPEEMRKHPSRPVLSSRFGFNDNLVSICSYVPKKK
ncbi:piggyBac transposable element-derived protein 4-like [Sipha flava]|uniref:PiggyBac transposable element-derived protein 4-like n=1 Tax=Sipha flava TaxID=143950 RepID=A0A8B8FYX3_9HEMI|nr:piggyBac transposable element-derived protein 4-like [Sipha flava]